MTALYRSGDPFITSDAVFGVKTSLITDIKETSPGHFKLDYDFVLVTESDAQELRDKISKSKGIKV